MVKKALIIACLAVTLLSCSLLNTINGKSEPQVIVVTATSQPAAPTDEPAAAPIVTAEPAAETESISEPVPATLTLIAGPLSDTLIKQDNSHVASYCAEVNVKDFKAEATFTALPGFVNDKNSFALYFRHTGDNDQYRVAVRNTYWHLSNVNLGDFIKVNTGNLKMTWSDSSPKRITIYAVGDTGYFYLNGYFIMRLDLTNRQDSGDVCISASEFSGDTYGQLSNFEDFKVWELTPLP